MSTTKILHLERELLRYGTNRTVLPEQTKTKALFMVSCAELLMTKDGGRREQVTGKNQRAALSLRWETAG